MKIGEWYRIEFQDGDSVYFHALAEQKNGGVSGVQYRLDVRRPRAKARPKKSSVDRISRQEGRQEWRWTPADQVPREKFAS